MYELNFLSVRMLFDPGINKPNSQTKSKLTRNKALTVKLLELHSPISDVEVKRIKSASGVGFICLEKKLLQHVDDMQLNTNLLLRKAEQEIPYPVVLWRITNVCLK